MNDQVQEVAQDVAEQAAQPEAVTEQQTASAESHTEGEQQENQTQAEAPKTFTQEEVDRIAQKERNKAARKAEREYNARLEVLASQSRQVEQPKQQTQIDSGEPQLEQFERVQDYVKAVARWELNQEKEAQRQYQAQQQEAELSQRVEKIFAEAEKLGNFDREEFAGIINPISADAADAIIYSDDSAKIVHYLWQNPEEAERIAGLPKARQAAEIGKLEVKLSGKPAVQVSKAPPPPKAPGSRGNPVNKNPADMDQKDFEKWLYNK